MRKKIFVIFGTMSLILLPKITSAHAFGQLYNLPVPFWMYLYGSAAAIVVSFLVIGFFLNKTSEDISYPTLNFLVLNPWVVVVLKILSIILFLLAIVSGIIGKNSAFANFNMTFIWIIFALGLTYLTAVIGNVYAIINPWKILSDWVIPSYYEGIISYPRSLGYYPALVFYFLFIWLELVGQTTPFKLSIVLLIYTTINFLGVITFGKFNWFQYGEFFSVFFRLVGKISPIEFSAGRLHLRPPFVGLLKEKAEHFSLLLLVLFMLSSTAFDGFKETLPWLRFYWNHLDPILNPIFGAGSHKFFDSLGLLLSPLVFLVIYLILVWLAKFFSKNESGLKELCLQFAFTLIPIGLVYNVAHYFTLLFSEGPNIIRLISDPFGFGWNLFGSANYYKRIILDANFVWHSEVAFILVGHIAAVYLAHIVALKIFPTHKKALISQVPMLILMVVYTMIGLWILSQPLTGGTI